MEALDLPALKEPRSHFSRVSHREEDEETNSLGSLISSSKEPPPPFTSPESLHSAASSLRSAVYFAVLGWPQHTPPVGLSLLLTLIPPLRTRSKHAHWAISRRSLTRGKPSSSEMSLADPSITFSLEEHNMIIIMIMT